MSFTPFYVYSRQEFLVEASNILYINLFKYGIFRFDFFNCVVHFWILHKSFLQEIPFNINNQFYRGVVHLLRSRLRIMWGGGSEIF